MLAGAGHPAFTFNFNDPANIYLEMRVYSNLEFGYVLAHHECAWCSGPLCVSSRVVFMLPLFVV